MYDNELDHPIIFIDEKKSDGLYTIYLATPKNNASAICSTDRVIVAEQILEAMALYYGAENLGFLPRPPTMDEDEEEEILCLSCGGNTHEASAGDNDVIFRQCSDCGYGWVE